MKYEVNQNDIYLWQNDFDLDETLDCGQAFRWKRIESEYDVTYIGTFLNLYFITQQKMIFLIYGLTILTLTLITVNLKIHFQQTKL